LFYHSPPIIISFYIIVTITLKLLKTLSRRKLPTRVVSVTTRGKEEEGEERIMVIIIDEKKERDSLG